MWQQRPFLGWLQSTRAKNVQRPVVKWDRVTTAGQGVTSHITKSPRSCAHCGIMDPDLILRPCAACKQTLYCSKACQANHWTNHKEQCNQYSNVNAAMPKRKLEVCKPTCTSFVGKQCLVQCYIQGQLVDALWDTESQVCIVDELWKNEHLENFRLRNVAEVVDAPGGLVAANGQDIPFTGWIEVTFGLASNESKTKELVIPVLVMRGRQLGHPIIRYNVIEQMMNNKELTQPITTESLKPVLPSVEREKVQAFVERVHAETPCEYFVKTRKGNVHVPKHTSVQIECRRLMSVSSQEGKCKQSEVNLRYQERCRTPAS
ncbi:uncharacterized protein LOC124402856 isoform X2 [Silurus meridionalis]|uniref:uncharacterized protein LOC124402856 isoform X2 n=1 Tax=Silurus meridionalis TaxID=175797 RepID=UPI001EEABD3D|nr:uncharacterized protein LOC124402856 isoform X2 [Silurus meridionalis]